MLVVKTKYSVLAFQAVLMFFVQAEKSAQLCTAKIWHSAISKGQQTVLAAQAVLVLCVHWPKLAQLC